MHSPLAASCAPMRFRRCVSRTGLELPDARAPVDTAELWIYASYEAILYGMPDYAVHNARPPLV